VLTAALSALGLALGVFVFWIWRVAKALETDVNEALRRAKQDETTGKFDLPLVLDILGTAMALVSEKYAGFQDREGGGLGSPDVRQLVEECILILQAKYAILSKNDIDELRRFLESNIRRQQSLEKELARLDAQARQEREAHEEFQRDVRQKLSVLSQRPAEESSLEVKRDTLREQSSPAEHSRPQQIQPDPPRESFPKPAMTVVRPERLQPESLLDIFAAACGGSKARARERFDRLVDGLAAKTTPALIEAMFVDDADGLPPLRVRGSVTGGWDIAWSMPDIQKARLTGILEQYGYEAIWPEAHDAVNMDLHRVTQIGVDQHAQSEIVALLRPGLYRTSDNALIRRADVATSD